MAPVLRTPANRFWHFYGNPQSWLAAALPSRTSRGHGREQWITVKKDNGRLKYRIAVEDTRPENLDVSISEDVITVRGERRREREIERDGRAWREITRSSFSRSLSLPRSADWEKAEASFENGVLEVSVGYSGEKAKNIKIRAVGQ